MRAKHFRQSPIGILLRLPKETSVVKSQFAFFIFLATVGNLLWILPHMTFADEFPMVGTWTVDIEQTAASLGNDDKARGFIKASQGLTIQMAYRPDGTVLFTKRFGDELETVAGTYVVKKRNDDGLFIELIYPLKGIQFEAIYQFPQDFVDQQVLMKGTFREHYPESESFGLAQGDYVIEVFYEDLPNHQKLQITQQKQGNESPVVVSGVLGKSTIEDDEVYFIEAAAVKWKKEVMGKDLIRVKFNGPNICEMPFPGLGLSFVWKRL